MAANGGKAPLEDLKESFRVLFAPGDVQKKKGALPTKAAAHEQRFLFRCF
jgi:hypothetical protein